MARKTEEVELVVVGAGPGGYAAAFTAADLGISVALVDPGPRPGGVCLFRGCIPSKALLHAARIADLAGQSDSMGLDFQRPGLDLDRLRDWKNGVVERLTKGLKSLAGRRKVRFIRGQARLQDQNHLEVDPVGGDPGPERLRFTKAILAAGSVPAELPMVPKDSERFWDSTDALELEEVPDRLLVVGGGYIGLELGTVYAALGSRVTVVEMTASLLPGVDSDLVKPLHKRLAMRFEKILLKSRVEGFQEQEDGVRVRLSGNGKDADLPVFDRVLVAVGRKPQTAGLGLENIQAELDDRGYIRVDSRRETGQPGVYAIGDLSGQPMLAHKAHHEGIIAAEILAGRKAEFAPRAVPAVVYGDPEVAWCGLTEREAAEAKREVEVARFPWAASGRALTQDSPEGVTKLVLEPGSNRVLGAGITGSGAGELIAEATLAVEMGATAEDLALTIHPHPTLSETLMEAAQLQLGNPIHLYKPKKK